MSGIRFAQPANQAPSSHTASEPKCLASTSTHASMNSSSQPVPSQQPSQPPNKPANASTSAIPAANQRASQPAPSQQQQQLSTKDDRLRATYSRLFLEMQYRATKNALMNYQEADKLDTKSHYRDITANLLTVLSASGILGSLAQKGKTLLTSKAGLMGMIGLPICGLLQLVNSSTSHVLPSYKEIARKHVTAAAGWNFVSERARALRLRMHADPDFDLDKACQVYEELLKKREDVCQLVLVSAETHREFCGNAEKVVLAMKKRSQHFTEFREVEKKHEFCLDDLENADDIYF